MAISIAQEAWTKDDLIDWLANAFYDDENSGEVPAWDQIDDQDQAEWILSVEKYVPVITAFVSEWLNDTSQSPKTVVEIAQIRSAWLELMS